MGVAHHVEPLVGGRLAVAVEHLPHAIHENLGAAARNAVEPGGDEPVDDGRDRQLRQPRQMDDFRRGQRVQLERGIPLLDRTEQILVPGERQIRIMAALQRSWTPPTVIVSSIFERSLETEDVAVRDPTSVERVKLHFATQTFV